MAEHVQISLEVEGWFWIFFDTQNEQAKNISRFRGQPLMAIRLSFRMISSPGQVRKQSSWGWSSKKRLHRIVHLNCVEIRSFQFISSSEPLMNQGKVRTSISSVSFAERHSQRRSFSPFFSHMMNFFFGQALCTSFIRDFILHSHADAPPVFTLWTILTGFPKGCGSDNVTFGASQLNGLRHFECKSVCQG